MCSGAAEVNEEMKLDSKDVASEVTMLQTPCEESAEPRHVVDWYDRSDEWRGIDRDLVGRQDLFQDRQGWSVGLGRM